MQSDERADVDTGAAQLHLWQRGPTDALWREGDSPPRPSPPSSFLPPPWQDIAEKLGVMALLLRRWRPPVSAPMMDSARMPHSFLLDQYVNPLRGSASSRRETILIYESISEASGQTGRRGVRLDLRHRTSERQWDMWFRRKLMEFRKKKKRNQVRTSARETLEFQTGGQNHQRYYFNIKVTVRYYYKSAICSVLQYTMYFFNYFFRLPNLAKVVRLLG